MLLPGLVNAHAHLDLAGTAPVPGREDFPAWLVAIGALRAESRDVAARAAAQATRLACRGVVAVGDIDGSEGEGARGRRQACVQGLSYLEVVGVSRDKARARLARALRVLEREGGPADLGLAPHAPYSVHADVLVELARAASRRHLRLAMHLAESEEETRYLLKGDGPFRRLLRQLGQGRPFDRAPGLRPVAYAERTGLLAAGCVVVHGNDLDDDDIGILRRHGTPVVYCHGTHRHFDRPPHRIRELIAAGVTVALGTDSSASNTDVDLFAELQRLAADRPDLDALDLLRAATLGGRRALGLDEAPCRFGTGSADAVVVGPAPPDLDGHSAGQLARWVLSGEADVWVAFHAGEPRWTPGGCPEGLCERLDSLSGRH